MDFCRVQEDRKNLVLHVNFSLLAVPLFPGFKLHESSHPSPYFRSKIPLLLGTYRGLVPSRHESLYNSTYGPLGPVPAPTPSTPVHLGDSRRRTRSTVHESGLDLPSPPRFSSPTLLLHPRSPALSSPVLPRSPPLTYVPHTLRDVSTHFDIRGTPVPKSRENKR